MAEGWQESGNKGARFIIYNEVASGAEEDQHPKGARASRQGFQQEQVQIATGAIEALQSKPEVQTKTKRS